MIDYIDGYDLKYYIDNDIVVAEGQLIKWLRQMCDVLEYLHTHCPRILHLDIKPANIMIQHNGDICLIDFGISMLGDGTMKGLSLEYSSPEQYYNACCMNEGRYDELLQLDERTDIYSFGATFYQFVTGIVPSCQYVLEPCFPYRRTPISAPLAGIIDRAVAYDAGKRYDSASEMRRAIDGMYKLSSKYKQYILIQTVCSALACLMIFLGGYLIFSGVSNNLKAAFEADYDTYLSALNSGDTTAAVSGAKKLINDAGYRSLMDSDTTAEVYHGLGGVYYEKGDYQNASDCYEKAVQSVSDSAEVDLYYRDYAISLIAQERYEEAKEALAQLTARLPDSPSGYLISAHLALKDHDTASARELTQTAIAKSMDAEDLYAAYLLTGDIDADDGDLSGAADAYQKAIAAKETVTALRKYGAVLMKRGFTEKTASCYQEALGVYTKLYENYTPSEDDVFNLAQCYLLSGDTNGAGKSIALLEEYVKSEPDSCRSYILLAIAADSDGDSRAAEYCRKAHSLYVQMSDDERAGIDRESVGQIKKLYTRYCGEEW